MEAAPTSAASIPAASATPFAERYRRMRSRWNAEWWSITFGGPIGNLANAVIAEVPWITPNRLTWLSFLCKLLAAPLLLLGSRDADLAAVVLFQLHTVLDCMDGSLARYRKMSSVMGAFLDKVTDMIGLLAILSTFGWRVYVDTGDAFAPLVAALIAGSIVLRGYVYWVVHALERDAKVVTPTASDQRRDFSTLTLRERAVLMARSQVRIVAFSEADLYFWLSLAIIAGWMREMIYVCGVVCGLWAIAVIAYRFRTVMRLEWAKRRRS